MVRPSIVIAEEDESRRLHLKNLLLAEGLDILEVVDPVGILRCLRQQRNVGVLLVSATLTERHGEEAIIQQLRQWVTALPVILIAPQSSETLAVAALKAGVADYFRASFSSAELLTSVRRCLGRIPQSAESGNKASVGRPVTLSNKDSILAVIGESQTMREIKAAVARIAMTDSTVLITGETGTGKELVASAIHQYSRRHLKSFIDINCAALPDSLLESELFGYERGAFTGANTAYEGKLRLAHGGTIFFDEIGDMSPYAQAKILRALETRHVQSLGGHKTYPVDVRIVAATNQELDRLVTVGTFRKDLYYRLNVAQVHLPPLRERQEDIPSLCAHYIDQFNRQFDQHVEGLTDETLDAFLRYDWPGNVRELRNAIESTFVQCPGHTLSLQALPEPLRKRLLTSSTLAQDERAQLIASLSATKWNKSKAAQQLQWSRVTLYRKMWKYRIADKKNANNDTPTS